MADLTRKQFEAFISKTDFDFSTISGWEEFLAERSAGGTGRDADGIQLRDFKNYAVGTAFVNTTGKPARVHFRVSSPGSGLALPPGVLYVYHPDAFWQMKVTTFYVGRPSSSADFWMEAGGGGSLTKPYWGSIYYVVLKSGEIPGQGAGSGIVEALTAKTATRIPVGAALVTLGVIGYYAMEKKMSSIREKMTERFEAGLTTEMELDQISNAKFMDIITESVGAYWN